MTLTVLFYILVAVFSVQIIYLIYFLSFCFSKEKEPSIKEELPVSVIVYTKNNYTEIKKNLAKILNQNYPNFEVVVINNASFDDTYLILEDIQKEYKHLKIVTVENTEAFWGNKKYALTLGIKAATYEHLIFTEIDARPISDNWINSMASKFSEQKEIVIGYSKFHSNKLSFFSLLARFEQLFKNIFAFSFAKYGSPFYTSEKNFAFKKSTFFKVKGYINHLKLSTKHSDLFIKEAGSGKNTTVCISPNSFISIKLADSFSSWYKDLEVESYNSKNFKFKHRFFSNLFLLTKVLFYAVASILLFLNWKLSLPFILSYLFLMFLITGKASIKLKEKNIIYFLPFLEICLLLIQISIFIKNRISKPSH